jgi:hypothetical protein
MSVTDPREEQIYYCMTMLDRIRGSYKEFNETGRPAPGWPAEDYNLFALIGEMDWLTELHRLIWEWEEQLDSLH